MYEENFKELAHAIVKGAVEDYKHALILGNKYGIKENERFFRSNYYKILTDIPGEMLIQKLKTTVQQFADESHKAFDENRISGKRGKSFLPDSQAFQCPVCGGNVYVVYKRLKYIVKTDEETGDIYRIGESIGYRATCFGCGLAMNREDHAKMYEERVFHCHAPKLLAVKGNKFACKKNRRTPQ